LDGSRNLPLYSIGEKTRSYEVAGQGSNERNEARG
jgi:hypothetical protein